MDVDVGDVRKSPGLPFQLQVKLFPFPLALAHPLAMLLHFGADRGQAFVIAGALAKLQLLLGDGGFEFGDLVLDAAHLSPRPLGGHGVEPLGAFDGCRLGLRVRGIQSAAQGLAHIPARALAVHRGCRSAFSPTREKSRLVLCCGIASLPG